MTMHQLSAAKTCFLSQSTENEPKPDELLKILEQVDPFSLIYSTEYGIES